MGAQHILVPLRVLHPLKQKQSAFFFGEVVTDFVRDITEHFDEAPEVEEYLSHEFFESVGCFGPRLKEGVEFGFGDKGGENFEFEEEMAQLIEAEPFLSFFVVIEYSLEGLLDVKQYLLTVLLLLGLRFVSRKVCLARLHLILALLDQIMQKGLIGNLQLLGSQLDQLQEMRELDLPRRRSSAEL